MLRGYIYIYTCGLHMYTIYEGAAAKRVLKRSLFDEGGPKEMLEWKLKRAERFPVYSIFYLNSVRLIDRFIILSFFFGVFFSSQLFFMHPKHVEWD